MVKRSEGSDFFLYEALQKVALAGVLCPDKESFLRHVFRYYSKTFHVPLPEVDALNIDDVLLAYYEESFENMSEQEVERYKDILTETPEERDERLKNEAAVEKIDDEFLERLNKEVADGKVRGPPKEKRVTIPLTGMTPQEQVQAVRDAIKRGDLGRAALGRKAEPPTPDVHMRFDGAEGNLSSGSDDLGLVPPPPRKPGK